MIMFVCGISAHADTPTVFFNLGDFTTAPIAYKQVRVAPAPSSFPRVEGSQVIGRDLIFKSTDANGQFYITNMVPGDYDVTFTNRFLPTTFRITVTNYGGVLNAVDLTSAGTNSPSNLAAYSQSAANARFVLKTNGSAHNLSITATSTPSPSAGQVLTYGPGGVAAWSNAPAVGGISVAAGNNITIDTNGSVMTINSSGGGGSGNMTTSTDGVAITNIIATKQQGAAWLTNISGTGALTNGTTITNFIQAAHDTNAAQTAGLIALTNAILAAHNTNAAQVAGLISLSNSVSALTNLADTKQHGTENLTNLDQHIRYSDLPPGAGSLSITQLLYLGQSSLHPNAGPGHLSIQATDDSPSELDLGNDYWRLYADKNGGSFRLWTEDVGTILGFSGFGRMTNFGAVNYPTLTASKWLRLNGDKDVVSSTYDDSDFIIPFNLAQMGITNIISADPNGLVVRTNAGVLTLSNAMSAASGEANTASSLGTGWRLFHNKSGVDLRFNSLTNGSGLSSSSNDNLISIAADWAQIASQTNLSGVSNLLNSVSNLAQTKIAINGGGGTNNALTNATWYEKLTAGPNTNGFFTVSNSSATAVGVLHFISTNGSGPRSIWSLNLTNGDMAIAGDLALDQISAASLLVTTWFSIVGPFTNSGSSYLVGPVQASSTVIATNFIPARRVLFASTNNSAVTNIALNVTNDAALTVYATNHLVWTNILGMRAEIQPSFVVQVYPQFTLTNLWPSGNVHGYRIQTNDNSTLWTTFTNGNKYVISGTADGTNLVLAVTRFSQ